MLTISLFGTPRVLLDHIPLQLARRKTRALLYYLAAQKQPQSREHLLGVFWPDAPRSSAYQLLRTTLHGLRKDLAPWLAADEDMLELKPDAWVDVRAFEDGLSQPPQEPAALQTCLDLYQGSFLADFYLSDSPEFEEWMVSERERYQRLALRGFASLAKQYARVQDYPGALNSLERALAIDPLQEDLQREVIRLLFLSGDRPAAIRQYDQLRRLLDEEMGVPPMSETRALYDAIVNDQLSAPQAPGQIAGMHPAANQAQPAILAGLDETLPFTGREAELSALAGAASRQMLGLIEGEPGIGKTRLAAEYLRTTGTLSLAGAARELERSIPYLPMIEALRGLTSRAEWPQIQALLQASVPAVWLSEGASLIPELDPASSHKRPSTEESRLWEAVSQILSGIASQFPTTLFLDDLQWADASTLGMLGYLVRRAASSQLTFIAATRPLPPRSPAATLAQSMLREGKLVRIALSRLDKAEIVQIARSLSPQYQYPLANWLEQASEGNPFVLAEIVRASRQNGLILPAGEINLNLLSSSPVVPQNVYSLIQSRLSRVSEPARRTLDAAVASGREFEFDIAARAAGLSEDAAIDALTELRAAGLVQPLDSSRFTFDHSLTMEVAYQELGGPRLRLLHRRLAEAMESTYRGVRLDGAAGQIAWHFSAGGAPDRAAPYALRAARHAAHLAAWTEAAELYEQATGGGTPQTRYKAFIGLGRSRMQAGKPGLAADAFRQAVLLVHEDPNAGDWEEAFIELAGCYLVQARYDEAIQMVRRVRESGGARYALQAEFGWGTALSLEGGDLDGAAAHLRAAERLEGEPGSGDGILRARIRFELGGVAAQQGDLDGAIALYQTALEMACQSEDDEMLGWCALAHNNLAYHLLLAGDLDAAEEHARQGMVLAREKGMLSQQTYLLSTSGEIALARGDLVTAEQMFLEGLQLAGRLSMAERVAGLTANLGLIAKRRGQDALAIHRLSTALARAEAAGTQHLAAQIRIWLAPLLPEPEAASLLAEARMIAESGQRQLLLKQIEQVEKELQS